MIKRFIDFALQQSSRRCNGRAASAVLPALLALGAHLPAAARDRSPIRLPEAAFAQVGDGAHVRSLTLGASWDWHWQHRLPSALLTARTDVEVGRWRASACECDRSFTRAGVTPVLRLRPDAAPQWFVEAGVGANAIWPLYRNGSRRFSTAFNFGDLIAVGRSFGAARQHEVSLRLEHFSNADINRPNPGENFVQLRYAWRFEP
jgi:hypothetical protein